MTDPQPRLAHQDPAVTIWHGSAIDVLRGLPENSLDSITTDPPYGLSKEPDITEVLTHWLAGDDYVHTGGGFMGACLHPDTDILTSRGWLPVTEVTTSDLVASLNPASEAIEYVPVALTHTYDFSGDLLAVGGRSTMQMVTPNHKVWTDRGLVRADHLPAKFRLSNTGKVSGFARHFTTIEGKDFETSPLLNFLGLWLGDGYTCTRKAQPEKQDFVGFRVKKDRETTAIRLACNELGVRFTETPGSDGTTTFYVYDKALLRWLSTLGKTYDKHIPDWVFDLAPEHLIHLYEGLMDTDGTRQGNRGQQDVYYTTSDRLADDFQRLCLHLGMSATKTLRDIRPGTCATGHLIQGRKGCWTLSVLKRPNGFWMERDGRKNRPQPAGVKPVPYVGKVHCLTLDRNHIMMSRFDGRMAWTGNSWDSFVPGPSVWREAFRVLKPGGYAVVFSSTRTYDLMTVALRMAGFEVRDSLHWVYGQGWPKSADGHKAATAYVAKTFGDRRCACPGRTDVALVCRACGLPDQRVLDNLADTHGALKPAHEMITLVRKPLTGTVVKALAEHGTGVLHIAGARVAHEDGHDADKASRDGEGSAQRRYTDRGATNFAPTPGPRGGDPRGRFPTNMILTHEAGCALGEECVPSCPAAVLDEQSGTLTSGAGNTVRAGVNRSAAFGAESRAPGTALIAYGDTGGASRFFPTTTPTDPATLFDPDPDTTCWAEQVLPVDEGGITPFLYAKKAKGKERITVFIPDPGCWPDGDRKCGPNPHHAATEWTDAASTLPRTCDVCGTAWVAYQHPTVKPVGGPDGKGLLSWLVALITPKGGLTADLYAGTGTLGLSAARNGYRSILIENNPVHVAMSVARMTGSDEATPLRRGSRTPTPPAAPVPAAPADDVPEPDSDHPSLFTF